MPEITWIRVSILTGPEGPVQPLRQAKVCQSLSPVSILTGPEGPVQRAWSRCLRWSSAFQSSPAPKDRCNLTLSGCLRLFWGFQSSPAPKDRCNGRRGLCGVCQLRFQSSPAPKDRCNSATRAAFSSSITVFQSSPAPKDRCNDSLGQCPRYRLGGFNPHRPRRTGATQALEDPLIGSWCFNPHRPRRTGATNQAVRELPQSHCFNPHRPRRTGATCTGCQAVFAGFRVSILTGPEGPVQLKRRWMADRRKDVSILTGPEGPVQLRSMDHKRFGNQGFNPHRPRRTGATLVALAQINRAGVVSILTGPEGPVQLRTGLRE